MPATPAATAIAAASVLADAEPGPAVHERVVERVDEQQDDRAAKDERVAGEVARHRSSAPSRNAMTRRSYSAGRASRPPTWPDSGISQSVFGCPAAR
jgi:hypothetical protein